MAVYMFEVTLVSLLLFWKYRYHGLKYKHVRM
jgi:hypothetical protein